MTCHGCTKRIWFGRDRAVVAVVPTLDLDGLVIPGYNQYRNFHRRCERAFAHGKHIERVEHRHYAAIKGATDEL